MAVYFLSFSSPSIVSWHIEREIRNNISKKQIIQQYKKPEKSNKKIFFDDVSIFMLASIWTLICTSNNIWVFQWRKAT